MDLTEYKELYVCGKLNLLALKFPGNENKPVVYIISQEQTGDRFLVISLENAVAWGLEPAWAGWVRGQVNLTTGVGRVTGRTFSGAPWTSPHRGGKILRGRDNTPVYIAKADYLGDVYINLSTGYWVDSITDIETEGTTYSAIDVQVETV